MYRPTTKRGWMRLLRVLLRRRGWRHADLAEVCECSTSTVDNWTSPACWRVPRGALAQVVMREARAAQEQEAKEE